MAKLKLDLHDIYNRGGEIDAELNHSVQEALARKIEFVRSRSLTCSHPFKHHGVSESGVIGVEWQP